MADRRVLDLSPVNRIAGFGLKARKEDVCLDEGVDAILSLKPGCDPLAAVRSLVERAEGVKVMKWIEFPDSVLVFVMIPGDSTSGSIYALDRKSEPKE